MLNLYTKFKSPTVPGTGQQPFCGGKLLPKNHMHAAFGALWHALQYLLLFSFLICLKRDSTQKWKLVTSKYFAPLCSRKQSFL